MKKVSILTLLLFYSISSFGQRITEREVATAMISDAWKYHKGASEQSVFTKQNYTPDKRVLSAEIELKRANSNIGKIPTYIYNPYPFVYTVLDGLEGSASIYYLPTKSIGELMKVIGQITKLKYDPSSPYSLPKEGRYCMEGVAKESKGSDRNVYYYHDYCILIIHEKFPNNLGYAVLVSFGSAIY